MPGPDCGKNQAAEAVLKELAAVDRISGQMPSTAVGPDTPVISQSGRAPTAARMSETVVAPSF